MARVAIIGGGAAGLAAAWRLASGGVPVTVFESAAQVGGRARSETIDGCIVDTGAQLFGSGFSALFRLARDVGGESLLVRSSGRDALYRAGRAHPITYGSVSSMVTSGALPALLKLRLGARYVPFLLRHAHQLDANDPVASGADTLDTASAAEWGRAELGDDFVELLAAPLLGAYYGTPPERVSAALYHSLAKAGLDVSVYGIRGGTGALMQAIADAAAARGAEIRAGAEVTRVEQADDAYRVSVDGEQLEFDGVVIALPAPRISSLVELSGPVTAWLDAVEFAPAAVLALVLDQSTRSEFFGLSLLRGERALADLVAICVQDRKVSGLVPSNRGLLICLGSPASNRELVRDGEAAVERMVSVAERVFPGIRERILRAKLYRHGQGYPVFYPGYLKHLRKYPVAALPHGLQLAGDYLVAPTVEGAIRSGERAAAALLPYARSRA